MTRECLTGAKYEVMCLVKVDGMNVEEIQNAGAANFGDEWFNSGRIGLRSSPVQPD